MNINLKKKLERYFSKYRTVKYKKGEIILRPGEKPDYVGFIKSGYVRVYTISEKGQEVTVQFFKPILCFTMIYALTGIENKFYFEAISPVELCAAPVKDFLSFMNREKDTAKEVTNNLMLTFVDMIEQMGLLLSGNAYNKVALMVVSLTNGTETDNEKSSKISLAITHRLIASLTGLTRETVTLQMLRLEKEGLIINKNRRVVVLNRKELEKAAKAED